MDPTIEEDGLTIPEVGKWARRKYHFLGRYLDLFSTGMKNKWPERHYLDLFASAGLARLRDSGEIVYSSAMLAARVKDSFTGIHCCEQDARLAEALSARLARLRSTSTYRVLRGDANARIQELLAAIPAQRALSIAFVDPFGLHFDFKTAEALATRRCDLIVLLADNMDALRNWARYYLNNLDSPLDRFLGEPGWRELFAAQGSGLAARLRDRYVERLQSLDYKHFGFQRVENSNKSDIYTLLFASRSDVGLRFWNAAASKDEGGQQKLPW